jgi:orotate phosphoribosyltransferase
MIFDKHTSRETSELLLQIKAIKLKPQEPFTWASGWKSPIYCDNRIILSHPKVRVYIAEQLAKQVEQIYGKPDVIAGVATGAIGIGTLVAHWLGLPFVYVRPEPKQHGRKNQIEGQLSPHQSVVVIEDLISTGKSSLNAVQALKNEAEANIKGMLAIFSYGFDVAETNFKEEGVSLYTLSNYETLINQAFENNHLFEKELEVLKEWRRNPAEWNPNNKK